MRRQTRNRLLLAAAVVLALFVFRAVFLEPDPAAAMEHHGEAPRQVPANVVHNVEVAPAPAKPSSTKAPMNVDALHRIGISGATPWAMHGRIGLHPDGTPGWTLKQAPPPGNAAMELIGNGFNARLSDSISLDRNVSDYRDQSCLKVRARGGVWLRV